MSAGRTSENPDASATDVEVLKRERYELLQRVMGWLETSMLVLSFVRLVLLVVQLTRGESQLFCFLVTTIWVVFILDFAVKLVLAPDKAGYFTGSWLTAMSLVIPALGLFRVVRALRPLRLARTGWGLRLVRVVSSLNRGMMALGASLGRGASVVWLPSRCWSRSLPRPGCSCSRTRYPAVRTASSSRRGGPPWS